MSIQEFTYHGNGVLALAFSSAEAVSGGFHGVEDRGVDFGFGV
jgi:hypothetical protein